LSERSLSLYQESILCQRKTEKLSFYPATKKKIAVQRNRFTCYLFE